MSLFILSFILLGFNGILLLTKQKASAEYLYAIATQQIITMIERLHALGDAEGIDDQIATWNAQNMLILPQGVGVVAGTYPSYTVTLYWGKKPFDCDVNHFKYLNCIRKNITI